MHLFNPFQWAVDASQKQPAWWCRFTLNFYLIAVLMTPLMGTAASAIEGASGMAMSMYAILHCWRDARDEARLARKGRMYLIAAVILWPVVVFALCMFVVSTSGKRATDLLHLSSFALFCSFAVCRPPAPPKRKFNVASQPEGA